MKFTQINRLMRLKTSRQILKKGQVHWILNLAAVRSVNKLDGVILWLENAKEAQDEGSEPVTVSKLQNREEMTDLLLGLGGTLHSYADDVNDKELKSVSALVESKVNAMRDEDFVTLWKSLLGRATDIGASTLVAYSLDQATLNEYDVAVSVLDEKLRSPRTTITVLSVTTREVKEYLRKGREILFRELLNIFKPLRKTQPTFVEEFEASLKVIDSRGGKRKKQGENPADEGK